MSEQFTITKRPGYGPYPTVTIKCNPPARPSFKLGLAVRTGFAKRADLTGAYLTGADLTGAYLGSADLRDADLTGAYLIGADLKNADLRGAYLTGAYLGSADLKNADLRGAYLRDDKITRLVAKAGRLTPGDQHTFLAFELETGGVKIYAGCRWFTIPEFRAHVAAEYPGTDKAEDTLEILDYIERRALRVGAIEPEMTLSTLTAPAGDGWAPPGFVLVPVEPTEAMLGALEDAFEEGVAEQKWEPANEIDPALCAYRAMLAVAPAKEPG